MQRPLRLLFISSEYPPAGSGGIASYVEVMSHALAARGHEVHVLSCLRGQASRDYDDRGVSVHRRPSPRPPVLGRLMSRRNAPYKTLARLNAGLSAWIQFRRLGVDFDLIEIPDWFAEGFVVARLGKVPTVAHLHGPLRVISEASARRLGWSGMVADFLEGSAVRASDLVVSPSEQMTDRLAERRWLRQDRTVTLRHPIDIAKWSRAEEVSTTGPVVLCVGTLQRLKGQHLLIEAGGLLAKDVPGLELVFVGSSADRSSERPYVDVLRDLAEEAGVAATFTGGVDQEELVSIYGRARVVAMPSYHETFSMVALEAMAAGRALVCTSAAGTAEILRGTDAGRVVAPGDAEALAGALGPYLVDPDLAARAGRAARSLVDSVAATDLISAQTESCYRRVLGSGVGAKPGMRRRAFPR